MEPSKGRIVNYHCIKGEEYLGPDDDMILPAIITRVYKGSTVNAVDLTIFTNQPSSLIARRTSVAMGMTNGGGWTWPVIYLDSQNINKDAIAAGQAVPGKVILPKVG